MKFTRRALASLFAGVPLFGRIASSPQKSAPPRRYQPPPSLWYENEAGEKWIPEIGDLLNGFPPPTVPKGFIYQYFADATSLHTSCTSFVKNVPLAEGTASWPEDMVLAMAHDGYSLSEAIRIAAEFCERCMNACAHDYKLGWGYERGSEQWRKAGTACDFCRDTSVAVGTGWQPGYYVITSVTEPPSRWTPTPAQVKITGFLESDYTGGREWMGLPRS